MTKYTPEKIRAIDQIEAELIRKGVSERRAGPGAPVTKTRIPVPFGSVANDFGRQRGRSSGP